MKRAAALPIAGLLLGSCGGPPAQLVVVVATDFSVPAELAAIRGAVEDASGALISVNDFVLDDGGLTLPFSFAVVPVDGKPDRSVTVLLTAYRANRAPIFTRRARTGFIESRRLLLTMFLSKECEGLAAGCGVDSTCTEKGCAPAEIPPEDLEEARPGDELSALQP